MKRVFYGICNSDASETYKEVTISDIELLNNFTFEEGDLLTVFFAHENTEESPSLVIYVNDTENEISTTIDEGKFIKTHDVTAECSGAWGAGETVIFAYTQQGNTNVYYWELIDAVHASNQLYGVTKLFNDNISDADFSQWMGEAIDAEDSKIALTPNALKRFFNLLKGQEESEDPEIEPLIGLNWTPSDLVSQYEADELGTLSITGNGDGIVINYPIQALIDQKMGNISMPTHTGQLINNGNGPNLEESNPFITKMVPDDLHFANGNGLQYYNGSISIPRIILNDESNKIVIGSSNDNTLAGIHIAKFLTVNGGINVTGNSTITGNLEITGNGKANELYENNVALKNKYSPIIEVFAVSDPETVEIKAKSSTSHKSVVMTQEGYDFLGIVGYNLDYANTNTIDASWCSVWECYKDTETTAIYALRNLNDKPIAVHMTLWGIYKKKI